MEIKKIEKSGRENAVELVERVFMQFEAPDYSAQGVETFLTTATRNRAFLDSLAMYGAYDGGQLLGVIATRNNGSHIALFFVDGRYHRQGIGKQLFRTAAENSASNEITVNSSPFAREIYRRLGFVDTGEEQTTDGIRYIPMIYRKKQPADD